MPFVPLAAFVLAIGAAPPAIPQSASAPVPRFEKTACAVAVPTGERVDCGELVVFENRAARGRLIRLPVMIFRSRSATPAPDPVLFMPGGPGGSSMGMRSGKNHPFLDERDYIRLEPRGARRAQPALECPAINTLKGEMAAGRLRGDAATARLADAAAACRATLVASGVDLDSYTSAATADDIEDLRRVLGIETWNLQGISYGTRLLLTLVRRHPQGIRSVILDSVLPPEVNFDEVATPNLLRALNAVFDGCAIDRECGRAYPDLRQRFAALIARADAAPLPLSIDPAKAGGKPVEVRGAQVVEAIYGALHDTRAIPLIPRIIADAADGRYSALTDLVIANQGPSSMSYGLRYSVWCGEEAPFQDAARVAAQVSPAWGLGGVDERAAAADVCAAWNVAPAAAVENQPVTSDVPVLIFAGEFDPDTPPDWGRQLLESMPNATYVEMRGQSHGAGFNACGGEIALAFLREPGRPLPVQCALKLRGADFGLSAWRGWWGEKPPYDVPEFALTHHARQPLAMDGGTVFHFASGGIHEALGYAR